MSTIRKFENLPKKSGHLAAPHVIRCSRGVRYTCFYCKLDFPCEGSLSVHLTTLQHIGPPDKAFQANPIFMCITCGSDIPLNNLNNHACIEKAYKNYWEIVKFIDENGSPNMCILCRGVLFETPAELNIHILISHSWKDFDNDQRNKTSVTVTRTGKKRCPLCVSAFITDNKLVLHRHAFDSHTPEIGITMLNCLSGFSRAKYGSVNDLKQWITKRMYSCNFPNFRVKHYPVNQYKHINRIASGFSTRSCTETFTNLFNLSVHLCVYHFIDDIEKEKKSCHTKNTLTEQQLEQDRRACIMQQEIDLRKRTLLQKGIILEKIEASKYCMECFRLYKSNFELQIHMMVFHLNTYWNICGICSYDCKLSLALDAYEETPEFAATHILLWNALWNHEKSHRIYFELLKQNPSMVMTKNCLLDFPIELKPVLEPIKNLLTAEELEKSKEPAPKYIFTYEQINFLMDISSKNVKLQTDFFIKESLEERN